MNPTRDPIDYKKINDAFVEQLRKLCADRGTRAELRRYWSESTRHYAYPVLGRLGALDDERETLLAGLFAIHDRDGTPAHRAGGPSVGTAFLNLAGGPKGAAFESTERHFRRLLASVSLDDLADQLHRLVKRLEREGIPLDYAKLLSDLRFWKNNTEGVKTQWALDFWQANPEPTPDAA